MNAPPAVLPDLPAPLRRRYVQQMEQATLGAIDTALAGPVEVEIRSGEELLRFDPVVLEPAVDSFASGGERRSCTHRPKASTLNVLELKLGAPDLCTLSCACDLRAHLRSNLTMARALPLERGSLAPLDAEPELYQRAQALAERIEPGAAVVVGLFPRLPRGAVRSATVHHSGRTIRLRLERDGAGRLLPDCLVAISLSAAGIALWWLEAACQLACAPRRLNDAAGR